MIFQYGPFYRIWPNVDQKKHIVYSTIALARPYTTPLCKLVRSHDYGSTWKDLVDFHSIDERNTTTGQPFITREGIILVPTWDVTYYTEGHTSLAIYRSGDEGATWEQVYCNPIATYGNHFFQNSVDGTLYIGIGIGGGGHFGNINYTPHQAMLLKSTNLGKTWTPCLTVESSTSLYSGIVTSNGTLMVTAREKKSVFFSRDSGKSWHEQVLGKKARCITQMNEYVMVTSDSTVFLSEDEGKTWRSHPFPLQGVCLRYPI